MCGCAMSNQGTRLSAPRRVVALPHLSFLDWARVWPPQLILCGALLAAIVLVTFVGPLVYRVSPYTLNPALALTPPSVQAVMGTDPLGRDQPARVIRNETFAARVRDFVTASRQFGARPLHIARTHILRMILPILVVNFVFLVADNILALSFLSFLGLGVPPPIPTWGNLLTDGLQNIFSNGWWLIYLLGLLIFFSVIAVNAIGEGVVSSMDLS